MGVSRKAGDKNTQVIINNITVRAPQRSTQDINNWRTAIRQFENKVNPSRLRLYDLYEDICLDGQIEATWGKRLDWVLNRELRFNDREGKNIEELTKLLNSPDMRGIVKELLNSIAWGYTLIQVNNVYYDEQEEIWKIDYDLIPRKHVHPEKNFRCISRDQNITTRDFLYMEEPLVRYMLWAGDENDMGLLAKACQYVIYKRGDFGDWSQFAEMFGMPFREATYEDYDEETRKKLEIAMEQWGGANYIIRPKGADLKIHDTGSQSGSNTLYKDLKDACNAEISKIFLGNTLTTEQGDKGARSLGDVHMESEQQKHENDKKYMLDILNTRFRAILKTFGLNVEGGLIIFEEDEANWDNLKTKWEVYSGAASLVPIDDDTIYQEFGIPKPINYDQLKEEMRQNKMLETSFKQLFNEEKTPPKNLFNTIRNFFV